MIKPKLLQTVVGLLGLVAWLPATAVFIESLPPSALAGLSGAANDLANGNVAAAEAKFRGVLEQDPESWAAMLGLADVAYRREDTQAVADYLRRALEAAPDNAAVQTAWGRYEYLGGEFRSAEHAFLEAARLDPELADPHGELGALYAASPTRPSTITGLRPSSRRTFPTTATR
jgi:tetratricopeptide (TPR) repeat protein